MLDKKPHIREGELNHAWTMVCCIPLTYAYTMIRIILGLAFLHGKVVLVVGHTKNSVQERICCMYIELQKRQMT